MGVLRVWDLDQRAVAEIRDDSRLPEAWPETPVSPVPVRCPACRKYVAELEFDGLCASCETRANHGPWEPDQLLDEDGHLDPIDLLHEGIFGVNELLGGAAAGQRLNRRVPPDSLDWDAWLGGDEMYFFLGACRGCGRPIHFEEAWDVCPRCAQSSEGEALWLVL